MWHEIQSLWTDPNRWAVLTRVTIPLGTAVILACVVLWRNVLRLERENDKIVRGAKR